MNKQRDIFDQIMLIRFTRLCKVNAGHYFISAETAEVSKMSKAGSIPNILYGWSDIGILNLLERIGKTNSRICCNICGLSSFEFRAQMTKTDVTDFQDESVDKQKGKAYLLQANWNLFHCFSQFQFSNC